MNLKYWLGAASFAFFMFGYGFFAIFVTNTKDSQLLTIPYRALVLAISCYFICIKLFSKERDPINRLLNSKSYFKSREKIRIFPLILTFCTMYCFRFVYDVYGQEMFFGNDQRYFNFLFLISWIPCICFLMIELRKPKEYLYVVHCTLFSFALLLFSRLAIIQASLISQRGRLSSEALNPISLGSISGSLIIISVYILLYEDKKINKIFSRILPSISIFLGLYFLIASSSRGPILSTLVCVAILFGFSGKKILRLGIPIIAASYFVLNRYILPLLQNDNTTDFNRLSSVGDKAAGERYNSINMSMQYFSESWHNTLIGYGVELPKYGYPHNLIVESFLSTGIVGGCIFLLICLVALLRSLDLLRLRDPWGWVGILYVQTLILSLSSGSLYSSSNFWYLLVAVSVLWNKIDYVNMYKKIQQNYGGNIT